MNPTMFPVATRMPEIVRLRPRRPDHLHGFVRTALGIDVARSVVSPGSTPPFAYLCHTYFEPVPEASASFEEAGTHPGRDCVVWANRGGGKTLLGAVATLLDLVFKPGIQVRILGGSLEQATKMHEHLVAMFDRPLFRGLLAGPPTARRITLTTGSRVEILAGSQRSVRGVRVHKLRCDEVEELEPAVWEAAQLVTRSGRCGDVWVHGAVEALSTMHRVRGTMASLVGDDTSAPVARMFRWNAMDVVARCPTERPCEGCELWDDCGGRAKAASGFVPVEDLVSQWRRTSALTWSAEMMCRRPGVRHAVYPNFDEATHVGDTPPWLAVLPGARRTWLAGMDFGLRSPLVMLWAVSTGTGPEAPVHVVAEYTVADRTLEQNLDAIESLGAELRLPPADGLAWLAVDPAGEARNAHSGSTDTALLRRRGYRVRAPRRRIEPGIEVVRRRLDRGTLTVHPRCKGLITALRDYHFDPQRPGDARPVKDGPDHACDALRYLLVQMEHGESARGSWYLP